MVIINLFGKISGMDHIDSLLIDYDKSNSYVKRKIVKAAARAGADYWLREKREDFPTLDPWLRRAFIFGAYALPSDEKIFWLNKIKQGDNLLERIIASWVLENDPDQLLNYEDPTLQSDEDSGEDLDDGWEGDIPEWAC
jgi:hypothetical protein